MTRSLGRPRTRRPAAVALAAALVVGAGGQPASAAASESSTTVTTSTGDSAYGQAVTASAAVAVADGPAQGDVVFAVDGLAFKRNLAADGTASLVLPDAMVGDHRLTATFVPQFPDLQEGSTSPVVTWTVRPVRTRLQVRTIGKGVRIPTSVHVRAVGEYGSRSTGRVEVVVRRKGSRERMRTAGRLDAGGVVLARFGRLAKGRWFAVVTYDGDDQHLAERRVVGFRVRQR